MKQNIALYVPYKLDWNAPTKYVVPLASKNQCTNQLFIKVYLLRLCLVDANSAMLAHHMQLEFEDCHLSLIPPVDYSGDSFPCLLTCPFALCNVLHHHDIQQSWTPGTASRYARVLVLDHSELFSFWVRHLSLCLSLGQFYMYWNEWYIQMRHHLSWVTTWFRWVTLILVHLAVYSSVTLSIPSLVLGLLRRPCCYFLYLLLNTFYRGI